MHQDCGPIRRAEYEPTRQELAQVNAVVQRLDDLRISAGLSKADLAREIGRNDAVARRLFTAEENPELRTVAALAAALDTALQGIAAKATKISDVLEVEARLTDVRGQIEQLTAQLEDLADRAAYATLTASFSVPLVAVEAASKGWEPATIVDEAAASLISIVQAVTSAGIWFLIVWLPILLVLGLVAALAIRVARRAGLSRRPRVPAALPPTPQPTEPAPSDE